MAISNMKLKPWLWYVTTIFKVLEKVPNCPKNHYFFVDSCMQSAMPFWCRISHYCEFFIAKRTFLIFLKRKWLMKETFYVCFVRCLFLVVVGSSLWKVLFVTGFNGSSPFMAKSLLWCLLMMLQQMIQKQ